METVLIWVIAAFLSFINAWVAETKGLRLLSLVVTALSSLAAVAHYIVFVH